MVTLVFSFMLHLLISVFTFNYRTEEYKAFERFENFAKTMDVDVKDVKDEYKDVKYVIYSDLDKYAGSRYTGKFYGPTLYKGKIEYYDANDKLIKTVDDAEEIVCINDYDIEGLKVTDDGYLINPFGNIEIKIKNDWEKQDLYFNSNQFMCTCENHSQ